MNGLASSRLITMDEASCIESTEAGRLMSIFYLDLETMKHIMKIEGTESLERLLWLICESHELADMHLRVDERRCLNALNRNNTAATIRYPMKGKITTRQMKLNCVIQATLGCLPIPDPSLGQEAMKIMRIADRVCKCLVAYVTRPDLMSHQPQFYSAVLNTLTLAKCISAHLWENSPYLSKQLKGIGPTFSTLLASAGKTNFMLLEESHPRDLERIMNKGPPAGNVLRKQVSLLPKYQLTITPVDERTISLELLLLNQSYLSENMENMTAGEHHKCYIVVGDSNNHLLLLTSFKEKDLISIYDGTIKYELKRKHDFEHKLFAHCISSSFVGIDAHVEYSFIDLEHQLPRDCETSHENLPAKSTNKKQTCITDTFKERKRRNTNEIDITQSKEKRKRDNAVIGKFKSLRESFGFCKKNPKVYGQEARDKIDNIVLNEEVPKPTISIDTKEKNIVPECSHQKYVNNDSIHDYNIDDDIDYGEHIDTAQIDNILNDIENEISKVRSNTNNAIQQIGSNDVNSRIAKAITPTKTNNNTKQDYSNLYTKRKTKAVTNKTNNYKFLDLLERNSDLSKDDDKIVQAPKHNGFSETIKCHLNKYLQKTENKAMLPDSNVEKLLDDTENIVQIDTIDQQVDSETLLTEPSTTLKHRSGPGVQYEIKEILDSLVPIRRSYEIHDKDKIIDSEVINIENTEDEKQDEAKYNYILHSNGNNQDLNDTYVQCKIGEQVLCNRTNDKIIIDNHVDTIRRQVYSETSHTKPSSTLKYPPETEIQYEPKDVSDFKRPLKQLSEVIQDENKIIDTELINIENSEDEKENKFKNTDTYNSKGSNKKLNDTYIQLKIGDLDINPLDVKYSEATYGNCENRLTNKLRTASTTNKSQDKVCKTENSIVLSRTNESKSMQSKIINCLSSETDNCNVQDNYGTSRKSAIPIESNYDSSQDVNYLNSSENLYNITVGNTFLSGPINVISQNDCDEQEAYVKNYSFSAIKINTCTKDSIKIVRKVNVNLNISEIMSLEKRKGQENKCNENCDNKDQSKCIQLYKPTSTTWNKEIALNKTNTETELRHVFNRINYECFGMQNNNKLNKETFGAGIPDDIKVNEDANSKLKSSSKDNIIQMKTLDIQDPYETKKESEPIKYEITSQTENLKSILDKYSKILGQNSTKSIITLNSNTNGGTSYSKSTEVKPNRPFKISEIHKIQAPLPKALIDDKPAAIDDYISEFKANIHIAKNKSEEFNYQHYDQCNNDDNIEIDVPECEYSNLETLHIPMYVDFEPSKDYKIDNLMLDPKTLLQCVVESDNDEIIPPPPQFCDETNFSADNHHEISMSGNHNQWCIDAEDNSAVGCDNIFNESVFEDNSDAELTPSKEIETWTLSRANSWEQLVSNPMKSFTVMRRKPPDDEARNSTLPRRVRLGKFKFSHKNKFKLRK